MILRRLAIALVTVELMSGMLLVPGVAAVGSPADLRKQISTALNKSFPDTPAARREQAREILKLYASAAEMPPTDRARWQLRLKSRLTRLADAIRNDGPERTLPSTANSKSGSTMSLAAEEASQPVGSPGGAPQDDGQALVELIQATIAPPSWDVNGGAGTIKYWPAWHVLVVRQTDDVHERIGGAIHGLRK